MPKFLFPLLLSFNTLNSVPDVWGSSTLLYVMIMKNLVSTELYSFDQTSMYVKAVSLLPVTFLELKRFLKIVNTSERHG